MANHFFRSRLINNVTHALAEAETIAALEHSGLIGRYRELLMADILRPFLPMGFGLGSGKIVDSTGSQSSETDVIVFDQSMIPPLLASGHDGIFPIESSCYVIEVKSRLDAGALRTSFDKAMSVLMLQRRARSQGKQAVPALLPYSLFAFGSDIVDPVREVRRYRDYDLEYKRSIGIGDIADPILNALCIVGVGYFYYDAKDSQWVIRSASTEHEEIIEFVAGVINTVMANPRNLQDSGLGPYLMGDTPLRALEF